MRTLFAFIAAATLGAALAVTGCGSAACNANTCEGCCSTAGVCLRGVENNACGSAGQLCDVCSNIQSCQSGKCNVATGGGAGGSGGAGGAGGGTGGAGGGSANFKRVFVTSTAYTGNLAAAGGKIDGLEGADALCNTAAAAASLGGTWKAWVSDGTNRAADRITGAGPWKKLDSGRTTVFNNKANLSTLPLAPIDYNENGQSVGSSGSVGVWTGTGNGGGAASGGHCYGFTSTMTTGAQGDATSTNNWTAYTTQGCGNSGRIYCFEL
jgi:hypothetical protein